MSQAVFLILEINPLFLSLNILDLTLCSLFEANVASVAHALYSHCISPFLFILLFTCLHLPLNLI